jgi:hypothetical protein
VVFPSSLKNRREVWLKGPNIESVLKEGLTERARNASESLNGLDRVKGRKSIRNIRELAILC